jgi:radical SAM protein with 4Fe4S-binding SPASM domain
VNEIFNAVEIEINHGCNKTCSYCPNAISSRIETGHMKVEIYEMLMLQLQKISFKGRISYDFYNEPMLSPQLENFVAMARNYLPGTTIELYSNGTLLTLERYRALLKVGVDKFIITKHEDIYDYVFEKTLLQLNESEREKLDYRGFSDINLTNRGGVLSHIRPDVKTYLLPCKVPSMMLTVTVKGNVVPCFEDFYQKNQMGNIMEKDIIEIWRSRPYEDFRASLKRGLRHKYEACKDCNRLEVL